MAELLREGLALPMIFRVIFDCLHKASGSRRLKGREVDECLPQGVDRIVAAALTLGGFTCAFAQTYIPLAITSTQAAFVGLNVSITACTYYGGVVSGSASSGPCSSDGLELEQVSDGRGKVELAIVPTSGSVIFSTPTSGLAGVQYTLSVSTNTPSTATITSYALNLTGTNSNGTTNNFYNNAGTNSQVTASLTGTTSACTQSGYGSTPTISCLQALTPVSSLSISGGLLDSGASTSGFTLNSATFVFTTAPEPASLSVMLAGMGGLGFIRRRPALRNRG